MKILALECSGLVASVAVMEDALLIAENTINYKKTHSQTLLPMLDNMKDLIELDLSSIDAIAVAKGPGSFTGLRIGSATAKGLGLALDKPIIEIPTLHGLSYNLYGNDKIICPLMDARRNQVYTGILEFVRPFYEKENTANNTHYELHVIEDQCVIDITNIVDKLNELDREVIFLGDGVPVYQAIIIDKMKVPYSFAPAHLNRQRAASVAALGEIYYDKGLYVNARDHQPDYLRLSQAERERMEQQNEKLE